MSDLFSNQRWVSFKNESGETMPPFAVFSVVGPGFSAHGTPLSWKYVRGVKYKKNASQPNEPTGVFAINGPFRVLDGQFGKCSFAMDGPTWCSVDPTVSVSVGDMLGPVDDEWFLSTEEGGEFVVVGGKGNTGALPTHQPALVARHTSSVVYLMQSVASNVLCAYHSPSRGFSSSGSAVFVWSSSGGVMSTNQVSVDFSYLYSMVFPGQYFFAVSRRTAPSQGSQSSANIVAISGGQTNFYGIAGSSGNAAIPVITSVSQNLVCDVLFGERVREGASVGVAMFNAPLISWIMC